MFYQTELSVYLKEERHVSLSTIRLYRWLVKKLKTYCIEKAILSVGAVTEEIALGFIDNLRQKNITEKKLYDLVYVLRIYFEFLWKMGILTSSPLTKFRFPKLPSKLSPVLKQDEIELNLKGNAFHQYELFAYLREKRHSSRSTVGIYRRLVTKFEAYCRERGIHSAKSITVKTTYGFIDFLRKRGFAEKMFYGCIYVLRIYFEFLQEKGFIFVSPLTNFRFPKIASGRFPVLKQEEIETILAGIKRLDDDCFQGQVMLEILYSSALRPREIRDLKIQDINFEKGQLFISQSKARKDRIVPIGKKALSLLAEYINTVRKRNLRPNSPETVFLSRITGRPHTTEGVREVMIHTLDRNGLKRIKPYSMRCTAATVLFLNGMGIAHINKLLGHSGFLVTMRYLRLDDAALRKELETKHPRFIKKEENNDL